MSRWAHWIHRALSPTDREVDRTANPIARVDLDWAIDSTEPSDAEVMAFLHRVTAGRARRRRASWVVGLGAAGAVAAVAAAAVVFVPTSGSYGTPGLPVGQLMSMVPTQHVDLGPSIDFTGSGPVRVDQADATGTVVSLLLGSSGHFEVDPTGTHRHLVVRADAVEVEVKGTVFDVSHADERVRVSVERGLVQVRWEGQVARVPAGEVWTLPDPVASIPVVAPHPGTSLPEDADGVTDADAPPAPAVVAPAPATDAAVSPRQPAAAPPTETDAAAAPGDPADVGDAREVAEADEPSSSDVDDLARQIQLNSYYAKWIQGPAEAGTLMPDDLRLRMQSPEMTEFKRLDPSLARELLYYAAKVEAERGQPGTATVTIDSFVQRYPRDYRVAELRYVRATIFRRLANDARAALDYVWVSENAQDQSLRARALAHRGMLAAERGDDAEARPALERAFELGLDPSLAEAVAETLRVIDRRERRR